MTASPPLWSHKETLSDMPKMCKVWGQFLFIFLWIDNNEIILIIILIMFYRGELVASPAEKSMRKGRNDFNNVVDFGIDKRILTI